MTILTICISIHLDDYTPMDYPNEWITLPHYPPSIPVLPVHLRGAGALFWRAQVLGFRGRLEEALRVGGSQVERRGEANGSWLNLKKRGEFRFQKNLRLKW